MRNGTLQVHFDEYWGNPQGNLKLFHDLYVDDTNSFHDIKKVFKRHEVVKIVKASMRDGGSE